MQGTSSGLGTSTRHVSMVSTPSAPVLYAAVGLLSTPRFGLGRTDVIGPYPILDRYDMNDCCERMADGRPQGQRRRLRCRCGAVSGPKRSVDISTKETFASRCDKGLGVLIPAVFWRSASLIGHESCEWGVCNGDDFQTGFPSQDEGAAHGELQGRNSRPGRLGGHQRAGAPDGG